MTDHDWMRVALAEAQAAAAAGEVPVGAVLVKNGRRIATGRNAPVARHDPSAHAEIVALRDGATALGNYRLDGCELFVTLEPCAMCAGAMLHARLARVVFGAADARTGAAGSVVDLFAEPRLNHQTSVEGGVLASECAGVLQAFFQHRRTLTRQLAEPLRDDAVRTPPARFAELTDVPLERRYAKDLSILQGWRMHYLDDLPNADLAGICFEPGEPDRRAAHRVSRSENTVAVPTLLCLHGPGEWGYFFRHLPSTPGLRLLVPDLIGFGRSDKPKRDTVHQLVWHRDVLLSWLSSEVRGPIALVHSAGASALAALLVDAAPDRFSGVLVAPDSGEPVNDAWRAPFPDRGHEAAVRALGAVRPGVGGPSADQARDLVRHAMGYFAP